MLVVTLEYPVSERIIRSLIVCEVMDIDGLLQTTDDSVVGFLYLRLTGFPSSPRRPGCPSFP